MEIRPHEKKERGEVFTPAHLVATVLDGLPPGVWSNPHMKWLEPTCGDGAFYFAILARLMEGLVHWEPDHTRRITHIVETMLFGIEITQEHVDRIHAVLRDLAPTAKPNLYCTDFFDVTRDAQPTFSVIVGKPPFNSTHHNSTRSKIYERILAVCLENLLVDRGHIAMITPDTLFGGVTVGAYTKLLASTHISSVLFRPSVPEWGSVQVVPCVFWARRQARPFYPTYIHSSPDASPCPIHLLSRPINPIRQWTLQNETLVRRMLTAERNGFQYNRGRPLATYQKTPATYCLFYTPSTKLYTPHKALARGYGVPKVIVYAVGTSVTAALDHKGVHGVGPNVFYLPLEKGEDGIPIVALFASPDYQTLVAACKTNRRFVNAALVQHLRLP